MTEKKKPESKRAATTQRFSEVAKELGIEVKLLLQLTDDFIAARPDYKDYIYSNGKKPSASSNLPKPCREELLEFVLSKIPKKAEEEKPKVVVEPIAPVVAPQPAPVVKFEAPKPVVPPVAKVTPPPATSSTPPKIVPPLRSATPPPLPPRPAAPRNDLPPVKIVAPTTGSEPNRPAPLPPIQRPPITPVVSRPTSTAAQVAPGSKGNVTVRPPIVVRDFAIALNLKPFQVIGSLMELGVDQKPEQFPLRRGHEAVENMRILADGEVGQDANLLPRGGELVVGGEGDEHLVAHTSNLDDDLGRERLDHFAVEKGNHMRLGAERL